MNPSWRSGFVCVLLATSLSRAWAEVPEPRLVADEFQEKLEQVPTGMSAKPQEALDFPPQSARFVRVAIHETSGTAQPGIDEFEIFGPEGDDNLALADRGAVASASSVIAGYAIHAVEHLNDGRYGNDRSWIAASSESEWVQIELPRPASVASVMVTRDRTGKYRDRIPEAFEVLVSRNGRQWQSVAKRDGTTANRSRQLPYLPVDRLPEKSWDGFLQYAFLRERATWSDIPADDHLSPLLVDRPAVPGGAPYWGRLARRAPPDRVLALFEDMIQRLVDQGLDATVERAQASDFRRRAAENPDSEALYLEARRAKRQLFFRDPTLTQLERILFAKRHPFLESHNYSEHFGRRSSSLVVAFMCCTFRVTSSTDFGRIAPASSSSLTVARASCASRCRTSTPRPSISLTGPTSRWWKVGHRIGTCMRWPPTALAYES